MCSQNTPPKLYCLGEMFWWINLLLKGEIWFIANDIIFFIMCYKLKIIVQERNSSYLGVA